MFECNNFFWHKCVSAAIRCWQWRAPSVWRRPVAARFVSVSVALLVVFSSGCLIDPQRTEAGQLLDRLVSSRGALLETPPQTGFPCDDVADVKSRLMGEPGLVDVRPAWPALLAAADALEAACGQAVLLAVPVTDGSAALVAGRARWQQGMAHDLSVACDNLQSAATALGRTTSC
jgi:hypothetical protein